MSCSGTDPRILAAGTPQGETGRGAVIVATRLRVREGVGRSTKKGAPGGAPSSVPCVGRLPYRDILMRCIGRFGETKALTRLSFPSAPMAATPKT